MKKLMTAPEIDLTHDNIKHSIMHDLNRIPQYDEVTLKYIDLIFKEVQDLKSDSRGIRHLWIKAKRGTLTDYERFCPYGEAESKEELKRWRDEVYPDDVVWYSFGCYADDSDGYKAISIEHCRMLTLSD